jgi:hypothetical protein
MLKTAVLILTAGVAFQPLPAQTDSVSQSSAAPQSGQRVAGGSVGLRDSTQPAMPSELLDYRRVRATKVIVDGVPGAVYRYARDQDLVDVFVMQYDPAAALRTPDDTVSLVRNDYTTAFDTVCTMAAQNDADVSWYAHEQDDLSIGKHTYRGFVFRYALFRRSGGGRGCQGPPVRIQGVSYYQQTYALPQWLVRIKGRLKTFESLANSSLPVFSKGLIAAMVQDTRGT